MKMIAAGIVAHAAAVDVNPLGTVVKLMDELTAKVNAEGEAGDEAFRKYAEWCRDVHQQTGFEIKAATSLKEKLSAKIAELGSSIENADTKVEELSSDISGNEAELEAAAGVRTKEAAEFASAEKELAEGVGALKRAISILERETAKNPAALAQFEKSSGIQSVLESMGAIVEAAGFSLQDKEHLVAFVQSQQREEDFELGVQAAGNYKSKSGGIVDVLTDMKEKAEDELAELRKVENKAKREFALLRRSLEAELSNDNKNLAAIKTNKAADEESKAGAEYDLGLALEDLKKGEESLATSDAECMQVAADHQATITSRDVELKALAQAKQIIEETTSGAVDQTYSFLQVGEHALIKSDIAVLVRKLAREQHSSALAQLASHIAAVTKYGTSNGEDPFAKIKGMIQDMIEKLEKHASEEATEKAFCDEQMAKTTSKKEELAAAIAKATSKIDQATARSIELEDEIKVAQHELSSLASEQSRMDEIRREEKAAYEKASSVLSLGLNGVRNALEVLRKYYGDSKSDGAAGSIMSILEVIESDFASNLAKEETQESDAAAAYEKTTQENKILKATMEHDVKYKTKEFKSLDKSISEMSSDRETVNTEHTAVVDFHTKLSERCVAKPESYQERRRRREAEISGLKEALSVLEHDVALMQRKVRRVGHKFLGTHS